MIMKYYIEKYDIMIISECMIVVKQYELHDLY